ncbi:sulfatase [Paenibacillus sp. MBLB4367]|uniref:sulfatase n=1 Tax=Paenibacillus sp. MBLB4367 TaxID=3384767 RepID=UPI003907EE24
MRAVMLMFDSLNKRMLPNYGCDWIKAPNFARLSDKTVTFDRCYAGSLPCMPARRELHTGRYNFLHRSWGPLEPYDVSAIELLKKNKVYTHLTTDHNHYFEEGGATYHTKYNSWEFARGQEGDPWKGQVEEPPIPETLSNPKPGGLWRQDWVNRQFLKEEADMPLAVTVARGIEFIERNCKQDRWFLQIEAFDPHEPFFTKQKYKDLYPHKYDGKHYDWPDYAKVTQEPEEVRHMIFEYAALVSMCDAYLGKVLDTFDRYDLWKDTMLIVNTDHGFLLGEHQWWGKNIQPFYNEIVNIPFFVWDPRFGVKNKRSDALVQTIDLAPTLLHFFDVPVPETVQGQSLHDVIESGACIRDGALFGMHGGHINCTDGRYVYMRGAQDVNNGPLYEYTLMPAHMNRMFDVQELKEMELVEPLPFSNGCPVLKIKGNNFINPYLYGHILFDLEKDPQQENPIDDPETELSMIRLMAKLMLEHNAPSEQFERTGVPADGIACIADLERDKALRQQQLKVNLGQGEGWVGKAAEAFFALKCFAPAPLRAILNDKLADKIRSKSANEVSEEDVFQLANDLFGGRASMLIGFLRMSTM